MASRSQTYTGIVLKRQNTGETDRIVTLLTQEMGKITTVAKGARKLHSSKAATLEPGNFVKAFCISTNSLPLLTQATLVKDAGAARDSLKKMRQLHQFLEIMDQLFVEEELPEYLFAEIMAIHAQVTATQSNITKIRQSFEHVLTALGFHDPETKLESILDKVSELTERPIRSFEYLVVKPPKA